VEAQGRTARCKRCGNKFPVPRRESLEDTILTWLTAPEDDEEEAVAPPRVISMPKEPVSDDATKRARGLIRRKSSEAPTDQEDKTAKAK
jgi:hypothetical protein